MIDWGTNSRHETWARWQGRALCSLRDPRKEAVQWAEGLALRSPDAVIVVGAGLGYHLFELADRFPKADIVALDGKSELQRTLPENLRAEFDARKNRLRVVWGLEDVCRFAMQASTASVVRFRPACGDFENEIFEDLLGHAPPLFGRRAALLGYDFSKAIAAVPESLAVNVKSLDPEHLAIDSREAKLLRVLRELVR